MKTKLSYFSLFLISVSFNGTWANPTTQKSPKTESDRLFLSVTYDWYTEPFSPPLLVLVPVGCRKLNIANMTPTEVEIIKEIPPRAPFFLKTRRSDLVLTQEFISSEFKLSDSFDNIRDDECKPIIPAETLKTREIYKKAGKTDLNWFERTAKFMGCVNFALGLTDIFNRYRKNEKMDSIRLLGTYAAGVGCIMDSRTTFKKIYERFLLDPQTSAFYDSLSFTAEAAQKFLSTGESPAWLETPLPSDLYKKHKTFQEYCLISGQKPNFQEYCKKTLEIELLTITKLYNMRKKGTINNKYMDQYGGYVYDDDMLKLYKEINKKISDNEIDIIKDIRKNAWLESSNLPNQNNCSVMLYDGMDEQWILRDQNTNSDVDSNLLVGGFQKPSFNNEEPDVLLPAVQNNQIVHYQIKSEIRIKLIQNYRSFSGEIEYPWFLITPAREIMIQLPNQHNVKAGPNDLFWLPASRVRKGSCL